MVKINLCKELAGPSIPVIGAVVLWGLCATSAVADAIYKSTDDRGHVTYSDKVVSKNYEILDFPTKGWVDRTKSRASSNLAYTLKRREELHPVVAYASREYDLSPELLHAVISVESAYNARAVSPVGAMGLMQLMPATASRYGVSDAFDAEQNIRGGSRYLRDLMIMFDGNLKLVLAAYNAGEGAVQKYNRTIPPYKETRNYVRKVLEHYNLLLKQQVSMR